MIDKLIFMYTAPDLYERLLEKFSLKLQNK
jgi:hypothetical protein